MNLHSLKNSHGAKKSRKRVGRGESSGRGKTSGKGHKGQMARSGHKHKELFEGGQMRLIRKMPKRGFTSPNRVEYSALNIGDLSKSLTGDITPEVLIQAGRVSKKSLIKILGNGDIADARTVKAHAFSATAKAKIEKAGGTCEVISRA
jgi:large subunit ribosomal protein L15